MNLNGLKATGLLLLTVVVLLAAEAIRNAKAAGLRPALGYDWAGLYLGAHVGYGRANTAGIYDSGQVPSGANLNRLAPEGISGGGHVGYNVQRSRVLIGIEGDFSLPDMADNVTDSDLANLRMGIDMLASIRGRFGWAYNTVLIYGTGGAGFVNATLTATDGSAAPFDGDKDFFAFAPVVGAGVEWAWGKGVSMRAEYLHYFFSERERIASITGDADTGDTAKLGDIDVIRFGINISLSGLREFSW